MFGQVTDDERGDEEIRTYHTSLPLRQNQTPAPQILTAANPLLDDLRDVIANIRADRAHQIEPSRATFDERRRKLHFRGSELHAYGHDFILLGAPMSRRTPCTHVRRLPL